MPLRHRGYGAYISCDGRELQAHEVKVETEKVVSCYIASEAGKDFKVHWVDSKPPSHLSVEIRMDGRRMGTLSHTKQSSKTSNGGFRIAIDAHCPYQFAPLATTDDDDDALPSAYSDELGTIEVRLRRVLDFISMPFTPKARPTPRQTNVHERTRKGADPGHCVSLGQQKGVKPTSTILKPLLIDDKPYVTFRFLYRPKEFLEANGILSGRASRTERPSAAASSSPSVYSATPNKRRTSSKSPSSAERKRRRVDPESNERSFTPSANERRHDSSVADDSMGDYDSPMADDSTNDHDSSMADEEDNKENVVEVHLSSSNNYTAQGFGNVKRETSVKRETPSMNEPAVKNESSPTRPPVKRKHGPPNARRRAEPTIKRELSPMDVPGEPPSVKLEPISSMNQRGRSVNREYTPAPARTRSSLSIKRESTPVTEIHLSSRTNFAMPGHVPSATRVKAEPDIKTEPGIKTEQDINTETLVKTEPDVKEEPTERSFSCKAECQDSDEEEDENIVEVHLSSKDLRIKPTNCSEPDGVADKPGGALTYRIKREPS